MTRKPVNEQTSLSSGRRENTRLLIALLLMLLGSALSGASLDFPVRHLTATPKTGEKAVDFSFAYTNRGDTTITIREVKTGCGCTVAQLPKQGIAPGESGFIPVTYTIGSVFGRQQKTVQLFTDDPADPVISLAIEVVLPDGPVISPKFLRWEQGSALSTQTASVTFPADSPMIITRAFDAREKFTVQLQTTDDPKRVTVAVTPIHLEREMVSVISLESNTGATFQLFVQVRALPK